ncbi:hypothetical protein ABG768_015506 [Culter alburnus]|uniref:MHC class II-associated invariant chain/CLIP MHC II-interacting domain-containing protein n=1 Tax=Culter alburnus TaxID=194366 RepID=A0AAW1Z486_CULAL
MSTEGNDGPLIRAPSEQSSINTGPQGRSNNQALKVAGITLLAGILIAGQAFTAYMAYSQKDQLNTLERRNDRLHELSRKFAMRSGAPMKMHLPMSSLALTLEEEPKEKKMYFLFISVPQSPVFSPSARRRLQGRPRASCHPSAPGVMTTEITWPSSAGIRLTIAGVWTRTASRFLIL